MKWLVRSKAVEGVLFLTTFIVLLATNQTAAQQASLSGNIINLPVVKVADQLFQVELTIIAGTNPVEALVTKAIELADVNTDNASSFDGVILSIPSIDVAGVDYWANFSCYVHSHLHSCWRTQAQ